MRFNSLLDLTKNILLIKLKIAKSPANLTNELENNEFESVKQTFFREAFFDLSIVSRLAAFVKDDQLVLVGFEPNCENNIYNKNLKRPKDKKQLKLDEHITSVKILPFYSTKSSTLFTFILVGFESGESVSKTNLKTDP